MLHAAERDVWLKASYRPRSALIPGNIPATFCRPGWNDWPGFSLSYLAGSELNAILKYLALELIGHGRDLSAGPIAVDRPAALDLCADHRQLLAELAQLLFDTGQNLGAL